MSNLERQQKALRQSIQDNEQHLKQAFGTLKDSIKEEVQVGPRAARHPYRAMAVALAIGFVFGVWPAVADLAPQE